MKRLRVLFILVVMISLHIPVSMSEAVEYGSSDSLRSTSSYISQIRLKGTLFTRSLEPLAIIEDTKSGRVTMYKLGDTLDGSLKVAKIERGEILLTSLQGEYKLSLPTGGVAQPTIATADEIIYSGIKNNGDTIIVDRAAVSDAISNAKDIMKNVKVKPYFSSGKRCGVKVTKLTPIGILNDVGVREGDVIMSINGLKIDTPHQIFTAYKKLKEAEELSVKIVRDDKPLTLKYRVTG
ncbi:MAG: PDZ domain-containing protein [Candidatus Omnitrophota bacterium]